MVLRSKNRWVEVGAFCFASLFTISRPLETEHGKTALLQVVYYSSQAMYSMAYASSLFGTSPAAAALSLLLWANTAWSALLCCVAAADACQGFSRLALQLDFFFQVRSCPCEELSWRGLQVSTPPPPLSPISPSEATNSTLDEWWTTGGVCLILIFSQVP